MDTGPAGSRLQRLGLAAGAASRHLNRWVEYTCAAIAVVLVLTVWLGVFVRYVWPLPITFTEEAARYLMIWMALLAISCGVARREHIGVTLLFDRLPQRLRRPGIVTLDLIVIGFFAVLLWFGIGFAEKGQTRLTMIYGASKFLPYLSVPVAAGLAMVQGMLVLVRDAAAPEPPADLSESHLPVSNGEVR